MLRVKNELTSFFRFSAGSENLEDWRIKISVLWLFAVIVGLLTILLSLFEPGVLNQIIAGQYEGQRLTPEILLALTVFLLIPLVMAFLSLILKWSVNRRINIILGLVFTGLGLSGLPEHFVDLTVYAIVLNISVIVATALIVWIAWNSKQEI